MLMPEIIPAATVIIVRDQPDGHQVLMVERHAQLAFAAGAAVFPGGRIDEDDRRIARVSEISGLLGSTDPDEAAARIAAIRESLEETGVAVGINQPAEHKLGQWRAALHQGTLFSDILAAERLSLDLESLTPFARWVPDRAHVRNYDTRFYLTKAPGNIPSPGEADGKETTRIFWARPQDMLNEANHGRARIIFPTRRNLERLAAHSDHAALDIHARSIPVRKITPWVEERDGEQWLRIPDDLGYPTVRELLESALRG